MSNHPFPAAYVCRLIILNHVLHFEQLLGNDERNRLKVLTRLGHKLLMMPFVITSHRSCQLAEMLQWTNAHVAPLKNLKTDIKSCTINPETQNSDPTGGTKPGCVLSAT